jgi:hypothetical protein
MLKFRKIVLYILNKQAIEKSAEQVGELHKT